MSSNKEYWAEIISEYKASGLSQSSFCQQNNLSNHQFQYELKKHRQALKPETGFESVSVVSSATVSSENSTMNVAIHFSNKIRCDITTDIKSVASLFSQLVQLC